MKKYLAVILFAVMLIGGMGDMTGAMAGFDGEVELSHPVDYHYSNNTGSLHVDPTFTFKSEIGFTIADARVYIVSERVEDFKDTMGFGAEYTIANSPFRVFIEHDNFNFKPNTDGVDYDITNFGFRAGFNTN